ncbi:MAG: GreA/GreB family elongation factor, partial [Chlamydiia bacterium]|nr:GreA/GreB family elongation factor [Chlamydiia bacterium]
LMIHPQEQPDFLVWYFQKLLADKETPKDKLYAAAEAFLTLLAAIEHKARYKELAKKMSQILIAKRYAIVRELFDEAPIDFVKEFLLLASKSHLITTDQKKNLQALAAVVHPSLASGEKSFSEVAIFWVTEKAMQEKQQRVHQIATIEVVENAREVEAARELGDLRENAEYKYAVQKRGELQRELKALSNELKNARLLTKDDIPQDAVGIGSVVAIFGPEGKKVTYTVLGPWDADPDENILSLESKFVQSMVGKKVGETFSFNNQEFKIEALDTYL